MSDPAFFGYGSLVNTKTHDYADPRPATLRGWRRVWQHTRLREVSYLSVTPCLETAIDGLVARVPGADWAALDLRERAYLRTDVTQALATPHPTAIYHVDPVHHSDTEGPILLSYLDTVVQGFLHHFGEDGVARFFDTTTGWHMAVHDDRAAPIYPRATILSPRERALVDLHLERVLAHA